MTKYVLPTLAVLIGVSFWASRADEGHDHGADTQAEQPKQENGMHGGHEHGESDAHHQHDSWVEPPEEYADKVGTIWANADAIARGEEIYEQQCLMCHGANGQGTGPMAESLSHPPADLTNNFHESPGNGDAYLFWRVSEGGTVEPFKSQGSAMPAFKNVLSESERWDVLAYVHIFFHQGVMKWQQSGVNAESDKSEEGGS